MFESLSQGLEKVFKKLRGQASISEANTRDALREIRMALLEADVNLKVVKDFTATCLEKALGQEVLRSVSPGQQVVKIVHDQLVQLMGPVDHAIPFASEGQTVIMLAGLQGSGKTTTAAKLAKYLAQRGRMPMLVAADVQRPAAIEQLKVLGRQLGYPVYAEDAGRPPKICERAIGAATQAGRNTVILDTAGRLHIDDALMQELADIRERVKPQAIFLVCDAMTGQDAVNSAKEFNERLGIDGVILTKLDGDARGGAALSIKAVTGKPIKFIGVGEKLDAIEEFHPDRMASRILGMGDVVSFVEKIQSEVDAEQAKDLERKLKRGSLTLDDFLGCLGQLRRMGGMAEMMKLLPGAGGFDFQEAEETIPQAQAIITSMTAAERLDPDIIDSSRRRRIASGSGADPQQVSQFLKQFRMMKKMMKHMAGAGMSKHPGKAGLMQKWMKQQ